MPIKLRLFLPVSIIIITIVIIITVYFVNRSIRIFNDQIESSLILEVKTISHMFEREASLKLENVKSNLRVADAIFTNVNFKTEPDNQHQITITNQETGLSHDYEIISWLINDEELYKSTKFVDSLQDLFGGTVTVFQKVDSGLVRIATNVKSLQGKRAVSTYIPNNSPVSQSILSGEKYFGRAFVVDDWYVTAYKPIVFDSEVIGALYVGDKEKDLEELKTILYKLKIGKSGYPFVFDNTGNLIIHPHREGENWGDSTLFKNIAETKQGVMYYEYADQNKVMAFTYFEIFDLYIAASVVPDIETRDLKIDTIRGAVIIGTISILLLLVLIYYFTTDKIHRFFTELQKSQKKLDSVSLALQESEERFKKLFDSTGDAIFVTDINEKIVEVNDAACEWHEYTREELMNMKITQIKSSKYINNVAKNRKNIYELGSHTFESEHITKSGELIQVEFESRLINYNNEQLILSVVRNISKRVEFERQILSAVIRGEEKERQRLAREMHDGLGPLLSALKLYVNELGTISTSEEEREMLIKQSNELIDEAVSSTRTISNNLMPTIIHSYGLVKAIQTFCDKVNKTDKLNIKFETENITGRLDDNLELILFRVISELINNTIKHAQADNVIILLIRKESLIALYYKDDGKGFVVEEIVNSDSKGTGLKNIISRVKSIKGNYNFNSSPGEGFNIKIEISL